VQIWDDLEDEWRTARVLEAVGESQYKLLYERETEPTVCPLPHGSFRRYPTPQESQNKPRAPAVPAANAGDKRRRDDDTGRSKHSAADQPSRRQGQPHTRPAGAKKIARVDLF
jgi:hypothetical protein